ncbi:NIF domain protein [Talaromyces proteolyticus]|uniref:NIF domain protein n=1 Tax=Talaromyces proteolyticus TaxID=1131652 RepID=A0AAD4KNL2_9EURO|nr:NIF domain protein [Talaromyces proteolyticus]KAH8697012.1 NIF domain protein [Talaromyces proteolyticus]
MNSLNFLSARVIGQTNSPLRNRSHSQSDVSQSAVRSSLANSRSYSEQQLHRGFPVGEREKDDHEILTSDFSTDGTVEFNEKTPLLYELQKAGASQTPNRLLLVSLRIFDAITGAIKVILSTIAAPGIYIARGFQDDDGYYSPIVPFRKVRRLMGVRNTDGEKHLRKSSSTGSKGESGNRRNGSSRKPRHSPSRSSMSTSESDGEPPTSSSSSTAGPRHTRSKSYDSDFNTDDNTPRRSIRIKLHNEDALQREKKRSHSTDIRQSLKTDGPPTPTVLAAESLKSPISSSSHHKLTKYPHAPAPPRPLVPLRQPSYSVRASGRRAPQKTLVLDLDETLIHSLAKGGRMSSGHMVEVKLAAPFPATSPQGEAPTNLGPQHPILYYVHKRPHCDEFLRKVCKWYKLVVFTASVQEYADPVIDWLEQERKFFQARYYRQHCTFRNGAFIKDLSSVEPDLSKVMILDNSPMSYIFHEDNAIPIEGWISDPTDSGLLSLIPLLEALQYVTDVRAFLALRRGEAES